MNAACKMAVYPPPAKARRAMDRPFSCDTMVALPGSTANGQTLFGKNSDRPQDEAQPLVQLARSRHSGGDAGARFVRVPQSAETYRHVGSKPWWCAGYEHGFNEHQVVIGNEALPTRLSESSEPRLIGMEVLRIALERSDSAASAVEVITGLVSEFGQGKFKNDAGIRTYDNSYIVADPHEAFVIECAGHDWAVKRVSDFGSISNVSFVGESVDRLSPDARQTAASLGLFERGLDQSFDFTKVFGDPASSASGTARQCRSAALLGAHRGKLMPRTMMSILSDHSDGSSPDEPFVEDIGGPVSLCMHRTEGESLGTSAASLIVDLCADGSRLPVYWCALYSPCMSLYYPVFVEGDIPPMLSFGSEQPSPDSPWWTFHDLALDAIWQGPTRQREVRAAWRPLQQELLESAYVMAARGRDLIDGGHSEEARHVLTAYMDDCVSRMMATGRSLLSGAAAKA